jgi:hypothetical protein
MRGHERIKLTMGIDEPMRARKVAKPEDEKFQK